MSIVRHEYVGSSGEVLLGIFVDSWRWGFGVKVHRWGVRLILIKWDVCISWPTFGGGKG